MISILAYQGSLITSVAPSLATQLPWPSLGSRLRMRLSINVYHRLIVALSTVVYVPVELRTKPVCAPRVSPCPKDMSQTHCSRGFMEQALENSVLSLIPPLIIIRCRGHRPVVFSFDIMLTSSLALCSGLRIGLFPSFHVSNKQMRKLATPSPGFSRRATSLPEKNRWLIYLSTSPLVSQSICFPWCETNS